MPQNKGAIALFLLVILLVSCIKRYDPDLDDLDEQKYIVTGQVNKNDSVQYITIGKTAPISDPWHKYNFPLAGCQVLILDDKGNKYYASENPNGIYTFIIPDEAIQIGSKFRVDIYTPSNEHITSDFDQVLDCPEVDSIYYVIEKTPVLNPLLAKKGIRFYFNLNATGFSCRNYRWEAIETWKYKAIFAKGSPYGTCYKTDPIKNTYVLTTKNLDENKYQSYPMHFVDNYSSQRLLYCYSLLLRQFSLSKTAYEYWEKIRINSQGQGGLYEKQPLPIQGNLHNLTNPKKIVLGFFGASTVKEKRIFVLSIPGLPIEYLPCDPDPKPEPQCVDCRLDGGTIIKPAYWPN